MGYHTPTSQQYMVVIMIIVNSISSGKNLETLSLLVPSILLEESQTPPPQLVHGHWFYQVGEKMLLSQNWTEK